MPAARRVFVAVTRQLRFVSRRPCSGSHPWALAGRAPLHTGCSRGAATPTAAQAKPSARPGSPSPLKAGQARPASTREPRWGAGEGRDWRSPRWKRKSSYPSNPTLTPSPHQVLFIKTTGRPSLKGITCPSPGRRGFSLRDSPANKQRASRRRFPLRLHPVPAPCPTPLSPKRRQAGGGARGAATRRRGGGGAGSHHGDCAEARGAVGGAQVGLLRVGCANPNMALPGISSKPWVPAVLVCSLVDPAVE